jgi:hypothetical protein
MSFTRVPAVGYGFVSKWHAKAAPGGIAFDKFLLVPYVDVVFALGVT